MNPGRWLKLTWPISIASALFVCAFLMVKFRSTPARIVAPVSEPMPVSLQETFLGDKLDKESLIPTEDFSSLRRLRRNENLVRKSPSVPTPEPKQAAMMQKPLARKPSNKKKRSVKASPKAPVTPKAKAESTPMDIFEALAALAGPKENRPTPSQVLVMAPKLNELMEKGLEEAPVTEILAEIKVNPQPVSEETFTPTVAESETPASPVARAESEAAELESIPEVLPTPIIYGTYKKDEFPELRQSLKSVKERGTAILTAPPPPVIVRKSSEEETLPSTEVAPEEAPLVVTTQEATTSTSTETPPQESLLTTPPVTQETGPMITFQAAKPEPTISDKKSSRRNDAADVPHSDEPGQGTIFGKLELDNSLHDEIERTRGHIELHLEPVDRKDRQSGDTRALEFSYPAQDEFEIDAHDIRGPHRLVARIYRPKELQPAASIPYGEIVSPATKKRVRFRLTQRDFNRYVRYESNIPSRKVLVTASIFEGASGDYKKPARIPGAVVNVINYPEWGTFHADPEGNIRLPEVPTQNELLLRVSAEGYYDTHRVIPVFGGDTYGVIYLIPKEKVEAITKFFTKSEQDPEKGIVMGRVFDPVTRTPKSDEKLSLLFRKGRALYIDSLPDVFLPATTKTGLFGFFNVASAVRSLLREGNPWAYLVNVRPRNAYYAEFGRGGLKSIVGHVKDYIQNSNPPATIRLAGKAEGEVKTDENGRFELDKLDAPSGVIALEVDSPKYPTTLHPIPFDMKEKDNGRNLFIFDKDYVDGNAKEFAGQLPKPGFGTVMGGAEPALFAKHRGCVRVELLDSEGKRVDKAHGPFPWGAKPDDEKESLCLTKANPRYEFVNLKPEAEYSVRWLDPKGQAFRSHVFPVGMDRVTVVIN